MIELVYIDTPKGVKTIPVNTSVKKVYLLFDELHCSKELLGVFSSRVTAQSWLYSQLKSGAISEVEYEEAKIEEWDVDDI